MAALSSIIGIVLITANSKYQYFVFVTSSRSLETSTCRSYPKVTKLGVSYTIYCRYFAFEPIEGCFWNRELILERCKV